MSLPSQVVRELFHVVFTIPRTSRFYKGLATLCTVVLLDLKQNFLDFLVLELRLFLEELFLPHYDASYE